MTVLSPSQLWGYAVAAGANVRTALAMVLGAELESGGSTTAVGGGAFGPWQLQGNPQGADPTYAAKIMDPRYATAAGDMRQLEFSGRITF